MAYNLKLGKKIDTKHPMFYKLSMESKGDTFDCLPDYFPFLAFTILNKQEEETETALLLGAKYFIYRIDNCFYLEFKSATISKIVHLNRVFIHKLLQRSSFEVFIILKEGLIYKGSLQAKFNKSELRRLFKGYEDGCPKEDYVFIANENNVVHRSVLHPCYENYLIY